ncbi:hypothetical protein HFO50_32235 [Rhizobium leguminosarum]|uniref:hypothetical protein n=1 Tax=Rhizobium leguminosarum TaxID=384 RepID=UPI001C941FB6|nr:hypothetical protein [Rhizobium leguminosarum]MBY5605740.1 hypothetical protein [Rhizobium leguminosarum]
MKAMITTVVAAVAMLPSFASADSYQVAIDGMMRASYRHMELTYACRHVTGPSQFSNARVAADNAVRATGIPTDMAMATVEKMASIITAAPERKARPSLTECTTGVARTKQELLRWRRQFRRSQQ